MPIGRVLHGAAKHGWHPLNPSTSSAWPNVKRFVNADV